MWYDLSLVKECNGTEKGKEDKNGDGTEFKDMTTCIYSTVIREAV